MTMIVKSATQNRIIEECKCSILQVRNINDYGMCEECPTYELICCQDVVLEPGLLTSFVASVKTGFKIHDKDDMAVKLLGDRFHCDPVRYIYHGQYIVVTVLHNFTGPDAVPLCFKTGENIGQCQILKGKLPHQEPPDHDMPVSADYNELVPNVYKRPVALRVNFPSGTFVSLQLSKAGLVSEHQTMVVQQNHLLYLSLCSQLPYAFIQVGEAIGTARRIHPRTWIKETISGIDKCKSKGYQPVTHESHKRKREEE